MQGVYSGLVLLGGLGWNNEGGLSTEVSWARVCCHPASLHTAPSSCLPPALSSGLLPCPCACLLSESSACISDVPLFFQIGEERATAISLMRKFIAYQFTDTVSWRRGGLGVRDRAEARGKETAGCQHTGGFQAELSCL